MDTEIRIRRFTAQTADADPKAVRHSARSGAWDGVFVLFEDVDALRGPLGRRVARKLRNLGCRVHQDRENAQLAIG